MYVFESLNKSDIFKTRVNRHSGNIVEADLCHIKMLNCKTIQNDFGLFSQMNLSLTIDFSLQWRLSVQNND